MKVIEKGIVISEDINRILNGNNALSYNYNEKGILVPNKSVIRDIRKDFKKDLKKIFDCTVIVSEDDITESMKNLVHKHAGTYPIISFDKVYLDEQDNVYAFLDCTRLQNDDSLVSRFQNGYGTSVETQIKLLSSKIKEDGFNDIIIADDVIFSGNGLVKIANMFKSNGINVKGVITSFCTLDSFKRFNNDSMFLECHYLMAKDVIDEICERDFYFGVAQSGISRRNENGDIVKEPYFKPYGDPENRASIPSEYVKFFSKGCIERSKEIWQQSELKSKRKIKVGELPEKINGADVNKDVVKELDDAGMSL